VRQSTQLIDPLLSADGVPDIPWFGDEASLDVDLIVSRYAGTTMFARVRPRLDYNGVGIYLVCLIVKALVRLRYSRAEHQLTTSPPWLRQQNETVQNEMPAVISKLCRMATPPVTGRV